MSDPRTHLFANNASSALAANLSIGGDSLTVEDGSAFSDPDYLEIAIITVENLTLSTREIMYCTARTGNVLTVERAKEGTSALAFDISVHEVIVQQRVTAGLLEHLAESGGSEPGATELDDLTDVVITDVIANEVLIYDGDDWINRALLMGDIGDVGVEDAVEGDVLTFDGAVWAAEAPAEADTPVVTLQLLCSDYVSDLSAGTSVGYLRAPVGFTLTEVRATLLSAPVGTLLTVDINKNGTTVLSTKLTVDISEKTSESAATPAVISVPTIADDDEITIDIDSVGTAAKGLVVTLIGTTSENKILIQLAVSDLTSILVAGTSLAYVRAPLAFTLTETRASLLTAGSTATTVDINKNGSTILSTKLTIDSSEKTSETAATPPVQSASAIADDDELTIDIDTAGTDAEGLIVTLIGTPV